VYLRQPPAALLIFGVGVLVATGPIFLLRAELLEADASLPEGFLLADESPSFRLEGPGEGSDAKLMYKQINLITVKLEV
jgi:hypothetical protein